MRMRGIGVTKALEKKRGVENAPQGLVKRQVVFPFCTQAVPVLLGTVRSTTHRSSL
jgi:hypothetical protein